MSYQLLSKTQPIARKEYCCIWCPEKINKGEKHLHEASKYDGEFQDHRWHPECYDTASLFFKKYGEEEFEPHSCKRGTTEEA